MWQTLLVTLRTLVFTLNEMENHYWALLTGVTWSELCFNKSFGCFFEKRLTKGKGGHRETSEEAAVGIMTRDDSGLKQLSSHGDSEKQSNLQNFANLQKDERIVQWALTCPSIATTAKMLLCWLLSSHPAVHSNHERDGYFKGEADDDDSKVYLFVFNWDIIHMP